MLGLLERLIFLLFIPSRNGHQFISLIFSSSWSSFQQSQMHKTLYLESDFLVSFSSNGKVFIPLYNTFSPIKPSFSPLPSKILTLNQTSALSFSNRNQTHIPNLITCARNRKRRIGYRRPTKWVLKSLCFVASNLNILPEPLALAISEFAGGSGGGSGFPRGFGTGGFDGWWRRRKGRNKLGFLGFVMVCGIGMWLVLGKDFDSSAFLRVLALSLFGISIRGWRRGFKDWVLGFFFCASLVGLGFRRERLHSFFNIKKLNGFLDLQKLQSLVTDFGAMETLRRRK